MAADDCGIYLWNRNTDELEELRGHTSSVWCVDWSSDNKYLVSGGIGNDIRIWDVARKETIRTIETADNVTDVAFSPDTELIAAHVVRDGIKIFQSATGEAIRSLDIEGSGDLTSIQLDWHPGGQQLAVSTQNAWFLLQRADWSLIRKQKTKFGLGSDISWSPDGTKLAAADGDSVSVWDPSKEDPVQTLFGHSAQVVSVGWNHRSDHLLSSDVAGAVKIWDLSAINNLPAFATAQQLRSLMWGDDGKTLVIDQADGGTSSWSARDGKLLKSELSIAQGEVLWSPDHSRVAHYEHADKPEVQILNATTGKVHSVWHGDLLGKITNLTWSTDGTRLAIVQ